MTVINLLHLQYHAFGALTPLVGRWKGASGLHKNAIAVAAAADNDITD